MLQQEDHYFHLHNVSTQICTCIHPECLFKPHGMLKRGPLPNVQVKLTTPQESTDALFEGGFISHDRNNAGCQNAFSETRKISRFDRKFATSYYYVEYDKTARLQFTGKLTV